MANRNSKLDWQGDDEIGLSRHTIYFIAESPVAELRVTIFGAVIDGGESSRDFSSRSELLSPLAGTFLREALTYVESSWLPAFFVSVPAFTSATPSFGLRGSPDREPLHRTCIFVARFRSAAEEPKTDFPAARRRWCSWRNFRRNSVHGLKLTRIPRMFLKGFIRARNILKCRVRQVQSGRRKLFREERH